MRTVLILIAMFLLLGVQSRVRSWGDFTHAMHAVAIIILAVALLVK